MSFLKIQPVEKQWGMNRMIFEECICAGYGQDKISWQKNGRLCMGAVFHRLDR